MSRPEWLDYLLHCGLLQNMRRRRTQTPSQVVERRNRVRNRMARASRRVNRRWACAR